MKLKAKLTLEISSLLIVTIIIINNVTDITKEKGNGLTIVINLGA
jgi:hypothetical protein